MRLSGRVIEGLGEGQTLGYPTANLDTDNSDLNSGVYAAWADYKGQRYGAALMVGGDFDSDKKRKVEVHVLDYPTNEAFNGEKLEVEVVERVGDMKQVSNIEDLLKKIESDIKEIRRILMI